MAAALCALDTKNNGDAVISPLVVYTSAVRSYGSVGCDDVEDRRWLYSVVQAMETSRDSTNNLAPI